MHTVVKVTSSYFLLGQVEFPDFPLTLMILSLQISRFFLFYKKGIQFPPFSSIAGVHVKYQEVPIKVHQETVSDNIIYRKDFLNKASHFIIIPYI